MKTIHLLLIEDDEDDYIITRDLLHDIFADNFTLAWVANIEAAREALSHNQHHVCLMDYSLGAGDGISLLREAARLGFSGPVIMLTGQDNADLDAEAMAAGAVDYLVKAQLTVSRLARAIRYAIARREMELERQERLRAESENQAKSQFLAHLSHELRTPLTAILGYTDLLLGQQQEAQSASQLGIIKRNGQHLLSLLNDILDLSKIEAGKLDIDQRPVDVNTLVSEVYDLLQVRAQDKQLLFEVVSTTPIPTVIDSDPTRLRQILLNLLGNAIKFTDEGSVRLVLQVSDNGHQPTLAFHVVDTGIGIPLADLDKLFKPFSQSSNILSRTEAGSGLGLAISQQLATLLGGGIEVQTQTGFGSQFSLTLPFAADAPRGQLRLQRSESTPDTITPLLAGAHILLADDVEDIRLLVGHYLQQAGAIVSYACNGEEALQLFTRQQPSAQPFDLLILDMQMPLLSGPEVAQQIRREGHQLPVIALTAATMKGQRQACLDLGFNDHLSKPVDRQLLLASVQQHLPPERSANPAAPSTDSSPVAGSVPTAGKHILLVEDHVDACAATAQILTVLGYRVDSCLSGTEALNLLQTFTPDIILCDLNLPDIRGDLLAHRCRQQLPAATRIIALTGADASALHNISIFDQVLQKPVSVEKLQRALSDS